MVENGYHHCIPWKIFHMFDRSLCWKSTMYKYPSCINNSWPDISSILKLLSFLFCSSKDADTETKAGEPRERAAWRRDSVVVLIGTTNRGKTTTMNIFTGNDADARGGASATTSETKIYRLGGGGGKNKKITVNFFLAPYSRIKSGFQDFDL